MSLVWSLPSHIAVNYNLSKFVSPMCFKQDETALQLVCKCFLYMQTSVDQQAFPSHASINSFKAATTSSVLFRCSGHFSEIYTLWWGALWREGPFTWCCLAIRKMIRESTICGQYVVKVQVFGPTKKSGLKMTSVCYLNQHHIQS